jgi:hypothetical protein
MLAQKDFYFPDPVFNHQRLTKKKKEKIGRIEMKIKKMKNSKTTKKKWELKMKEKEPLQCWIVNIMSSTNPFN